MNARIETNENGSKTLFVYYEGNAFNEAIESALEAYGLIRQQVAVIAIPRDIKVRITT